MIKFIEIIHALCTVNKNPWFINDSFMHDQKQNFCGRGIFFHAPDHQALALYTRQFCQISSPKLKLVETWLNLTKLDQTWPNLTLWKKIDRACNIYNVLAVKCNSTMLEQVSKSQKQICGILNSSEKQTKNCCHKGHNESIKMQCDLYEC